MDRRQENIFKPRFKTGNLGQEQKFKIKEDIIYYHKKCLKGYLIEQIGYFNKNKDLHEQFCNNIFAKIIELENHEQYRIKDILRVAARKYCFEVLLIHEKNEKFNVLDISNVVDHDNNFKELYRNLMNIFNN